MISGMQDLSLNNDPKAEKIFTERQNGEHFENRGKNVKKIKSRYKKIPPYPGTMVDTTPSLRLSTTQALFNCTLINIQIESGPRHFSKNRALKETHSGKINFPSAFLINVSVSFYT